MLLTGGKKKILYLLHCYYNRAGTEEHTRMLAEGLTQDFEIYIVAIENGRMMLLNKGEELLSISVPPLPFPMTPLHSAPHEVALSQVLDTVQPDLIHIQHIHNWPLSVFAQVLSVGKPVVMTFHDYYAFTPHWTMEGVSDPKFVTTKEYSLQIFGQDISEYLAKRQAVFREALLLLALRVVPSNYLAAVMSEGYPGEYRVIEHGIRPYCPHKKQTAPQKVTFGYVGSLLPQKGYAHVLPVFSELKKRFPQVELEVYGSGPLSNLNISLQGVRYHGVFEQEDIPKIMARVDIGLIPSVFAETFSLSLSEYWHGRVPVVASRIGALSERITEGKDGGLFNPGDEADMLRVLSKVIDREEWKQWAVPQPRLLNGMLSEYKEMYMGVL